MAHRRAVQTPTELHTNSFSMYALVTCASTGFFVPNSLATGLEPCVIITYTLKLPFALYFSFKRSTRATHLSLHSRLSNPQLVSNLHLLTIFNSVQLHNGDFINRTS